MPFNVYQEYISRKDVILLKVLQKVLGADMYTSYYVHKYDQRSKVYNNEFVNKCGYTAYNVIVVRGARP